MTAKEKFLNSCCEHGVGEYFIQGCIDDLKGGNSVVVISQKTNHIMRFGYWDNFYGMTDTCMTMESLHDCTEFIHSLFDPDDANATYELWTCDSRRMKLLWDWFATQDYGEFPLPLSALNRTQFFNNFDSISVGTVFEDDKEPDPVESFKHDETYLMMKGSHQGGIQIIREAQERWKKTIIESIKDAWTAGLTWNAEIFCVVQRNGDHIVAHEVGGAHLCLLTEDADRDLYDSLLLKFSLV